MHRRPLTRRRALGLGATGLAAAASLRPTTALARRPAAFGLDLDDLGDGPGGWRTLAPTRAPRRFDLLGLEWTGDGPVRAEVRARRRGGTWTPWTRLHASGDHAPDGARATAGTEPCWTGTADEFQVRLRGGLPRRLRARFVRARPAAEAARRLHARASASAARRRRLSDAAAEAPAIIPRSAWGGDRYPPKAPPEHGSVQVGFVHHTVTANAYGPEDSAAIVLGICRYHRDHNGWNDIGYNFLVDQYGQVFEGRAGGVDQAIVGAQAQGYNSVSTGVACLGDFTATAFPAAGAEAVAQLLAWKLPLHGAPVTGQVTVTSAGGASNRYPAGRGVTFERISGHRDGDATACPGGVLYGQLPAIRDRAAALAAAAPAPADSLTITAPVTVVPVGTPVHLTGALHFGDGSTPAARPLAVEYQRGPGAPWQVLTAVMTDGAGGWSTAIDAYASGRLRATFSGDGLHPPLQAPPVALEVTPDVTVEISDATVRAGRRVRVTGTVGPTWPSRLRLTLERHTGRGIVRVRRRRVRIRDGRFSTSVRLARRGRHRLTIEAAGSTVRRKLRAT